MGKPLRVLIIENSQDSADVLEYQLRRGGFEPACQRVQTAGVLREALAGAEWDVILSDALMPGFSGIQALDIVRRSGIDIPFIVISGAISEDVAVRLMKAGAHDYFAKGALSRLCAAVEREITECRVRRSRKKVESHQEIAVEVLEILNREDQAQNLIRDLAHLFKERGGFDAVGVRLRQGEDYPFVLGEGFPPGFQDMENRLCSRNADGSIARDAAGQPILECFCGTVIRGQDRSAIPLFTKGGSFWTNNLEDSRARAVAQDAGRALRRCCLDAGFVSMTMLPLRFGAEIIGLLHLASRRSRRFDPDDIAFMEDLAASIAVALRRRETEEKTAWLATFPEFNPNPVVELDWDGKLVYLNPACRRMFPSLEADNLAHPWLEGLREMLAGSRRESNEPILRELQIGGQWYRQSIGFVAETRKVRIYGMDITEIRQAQEQLRQSQRMEAVGRLAGGIAHDFNNLLTAISGFSEFLLAALPANDPKRGDVEEIKKAGARAASLTRQLLAFSRKQILQPRILSLDVLIPEMIKLIRRTIGEDIEFKTILDSVSANIKADPGQVEQVILNLVINARDAMPDGGRLVLETARTELGEDYARSHPEVVPGSYVMLAVSDTGIGMTPEVMGRIFEPFFTTKESGKGTGLGLSTVYGIVKQSGGSIFVYSEPGKGTSFKIFFPRVDEKAIAERTESLSLESCAGTETVLVVEDDETVRKFVQRVLMERGYDVRTAAAPEEALALCGDHGVDIRLMITDVILPKMNGRELSQRAAKLCPGMRTVFMSGYTDNVIVHHGILDPGIAFIEKPLSPAAILRAARKVLDAHP